MSSDVISEAILQGSSFVDRFHLAGVIPLNFFLMSSWSCAKSFGRVMFRYGMVHWTFTHKILLVVSRERPNHFQVPPCALHLGRNRTCASVPYMYWLVQQKLGSEKNFSSGIVGIVWYCTCVWYNTIGASPIFCCLYLVLVYRAPATSIYVTYLSSHKK